MRMWLFLESICSCRVLVVIGTCLFFLFTGMPIADPLPRYILRVGGTHLHWRDANLLIVVQKKKKRYVKPILVISQATPSYQGLYQKTCVLRKMVFVWMRRNLQWLVCIFKMFTLGYSIKFRSSIGSIKWKHNLIEFCFGMVLMLSCIIYISCKGKWWCYSVIIMYIFPNRIF